MKRKIQIGFLAMVWMCLCCLLPVSATPGVNDYPYSTHSSSGIDPWNFYKRNCTSFVAWRLNNDNGVAFTNQYLGASKWGNAKNWYTVAQSFGIKVDSQPAVGSVACWTTGGGGAGHVAWVMSYDTSSVTIEEYNYDVSLGYGTRTITKGSAKYPQYFIHIKDLGVTITNDIPSVYVKESQSFTFEVEKPFEKTDVKWESSNPSVLEVNSNGTITGKAEGTAKITAFIKDKNGKIVSSDSRTVEVKKTTIELNYTSATLYGDETLQLTAVIEGPTNNVTWTVDSSLYTTVDKNGLVKMGSMESTRTTTATVTASANGVSATCKITREPGIIKFSNSSYTLDAGVVKTIKPTTKGVKKVKYTSNNTKVATVDSSTGKVTVIKEGTAKITAAGSGGSASYTIKAKPVVKLNKSSLKMDMDSSQKLTVTVKGSSAWKKWTSSNSNVASVTSTGTIKPKKAGTTTIKVSVNGVHGTVSATCKVTVVAPKITLNKNSLDLVKNKTVTLTATVKNTKKTVKWKSNNSKIVSLTRNGNKVVIKGKKVGSATITAYIGDVKATCKIKVEESNWKGLYYNFLKKAESSFNYKEGKYTRTAKARSFYLLHLNSDKTPELVVSSDTYNIGTMENFMVFTIKNNKVVYAGSVVNKGLSNVCYNKKYKAISNGWWTNDVGGSGEALWIVKNGKLVQYKYAYGYYNAKGKRIYKTGNTVSTAKVVSASSSKAFGKKYFNSKHKVNGTRLQNTESVRLKQFK